MCSISFDPNKMERLVRGDAFLRFAVDDLVSKSHSRKKALEIVFNSYVLEDSVMEDKYEKA
ncbi:hypothetical protein IJ21_34670 [Paenibacillus sp. 32O-W]|uniref:hypothetical protein n=1 Tax=Paenibacillus sp. 32O-W TaxID=1695218 RepID=UPI00071EA4DA|nr:hypothetical protein [Paenibacillus sp. 32O-W]ALS28856.1 hypothetical protein IJ21_34670 [Paenibacillus sp. 32O-W]